MTKRLFLLTVLFFTLNYPSYCQTPVPTTTGFYRIDDDKNITRISPNVFVASRVSGAIGEILTNGIKKSKTRAVLSGSAAKIRIKKNQQFLYRTVDKLIPMEYYLLRLAVTKNEREVVVATSGLYQTTGPDSESVIPFSVNKIGDGKYLLSVSLEPGEYCFYPKKGFQTTGAIGGGVITKSKVFDFGVD